MGSPLSPIIADLVMQDLETSAIKKLPFDIPFYFRYVDDILLAIPENEIDTTVNVFNSLHDRLQFTYETSINNVINFLNVTVYVEENQFIFDLFFKPSFSGRYLHFHSNHPITQKRALIFGLVDKIIKLSHPRFQQKNFEYVINNLLQNGYRISFIFNNIKKRLNYLLLESRNNNNNQNCEQDNEQNNKEKKREGFLRVPFINNVTRSFTNIARKNNLNAIFTINNKLTNFIKTGKDNIDKLKHSNVVYRISCNDCDATYVGQTKRQLNTRIREHKLDINKTTGLPSVISQHRLSNNHEFQWDDIDILDKERKYHNRLISEMIHIKKQKNSINKQNDTEQFPDIYLPLIKM